METTELYEMREQIALLKEKLNKEAIVNERLVHETMRNRINYLQRQERLSYLAALFVIVFGSICFYSLHLPVWFIGATAVFMMLIAFFNFFIHRKIHNDNLLNGDLLTTAKAFRTLKQNHITWHRVGIGCVLVWITCFIWQLYLVQGDKESVIYIAISGLIGGLIGGIIGYRKYCKVLDTCDSLIAQLEE